MTNRLSLEQKVQRKLERRTRQAIEADKRFWSQVELDEHTGCWLWRGNRNWAGYGLFNYFEKTIVAHRFAYSSACGFLIPKGKFVLHHCDVRHCVNVVEHLYLGDHQQNMQDRTLRKRGTRGSDRDDQEIIDIRNLYQQGWSYPQLAKYYDISTSQAFNIVTGVNWSQIGGPILGVDYEIPISLRRSRRIFDSSVHT